MRGVGPVCDAVRSRVAVEGRGAQPMRDTAHSDSGGTDTGAADDPTTVGASFEASAEPDGPGDEAGDGAVSESSTRSLEWTSVFRYAVADKRALYLALLDVFLDAKRRYRVHLRADEVRAEVLAAAGVVDALDDGLPDELDAELDQLAAWGNLRRSQDTREARTLEEFRRRRSLYQLTAAGAEAHEAVRRVERAFEDSAGSLSVGLLPRVVEKLRAIDSELRADAPDGEKLFGLLTELHGLSSDLADNSSRFMSDLGVSLEELTASADRWAAFKHAVLIYLQLFIGRLAEERPRVCGLLRDLGGERGRRMLELAAAADEAPDLIAGRVTPLARLTERWRGLVRWFLGEADGRAEADLLATAATDAIGRILRVLGALHDKRFRRVNRASDLMRVAEWFLAAPTAAAAHRLHDVAFGLFPARHVSQVSPDDELDHGRSLWDAAPIPVEARVVKSGRVGGVGRPTRVRDYSAAKRRALELLRRREDRVRRAARKLGDPSRDGDTGSDGAVRLSQLGRLSEDELQLLLSLLGDALRARGAGGPWRGVVAEGGVEATFELVPDAPEIRVTTSVGTLRCPEFFVRVAVVGEATHAVVEGNAIVEADVEVDVAALVNVGATT